MLREPTDAIVRLTTSTICGTDLHILKGDVPSVTEGRILGHEGVGVVTEVGAGVTAFHAGDRVLISCITSCGRCDFCRKQMYSHCRHGGWILGNTIDGTQAEYVRIPHADTSLYAIPADGDEEALVMLSDILPTGFECGVLNGQVQPGDSRRDRRCRPGRACGAADGPVLLARQHHGHRPRRHATGRGEAFGATALINSTDGGAVQRVMDLTAGQGVDVAIEAVGVPATFDICQAILAPGGRLANVGVHGVAVTLHLEKLWDRNITITTRLVDTTTTPMLLKGVVSGRLPARQLVTHRFALDDIMQAYETFEHAASEGALKVILTNDIRG